MRYLVFGDIHGNIAALDAVLAIGQGRGVDGYFCTGDVVGYGANPLECIERIFELKQRGLLAWVAGNHELAVRGEVDLAGYTEEAARTLEWTRRMLTKHPWAMRFIEAGETTVHVNDAVFLTHDSLADPTSGAYHRSPQNAKSELACLRYRGGRVCFYGHTHLMRAELLRNGAVALAPMEAHGGVENDPQPIRLGADELGWIGVGSVGLPKSPSRLPEYAILDDSDWHIEKYTVQYPREAVRASTRTALGPICGEAVAERIARWM